MKGISMPIETVVTIVIAVIVLTVIVLFFSGQFNPSAGNINAQQRQATNCGVLVRETNGKCDRLSSDSSINDNIKQACMDLKGYPKCQSGTMEECLKDCCKTYCTG